jgi:type IV secretory pathway protease TraF
VFLDGSCCFLMVLVVSCWFLLFLLVLFGSGGMRLALSLEMISPIHWRWLLPSMGAMLLLLIATLRQGDWLIYNATASMPKGWYLRTAASLGRGLIVTVRARDVAPAYARIRDFDRDGDRFLKRIAAGAGDLVCGRGDRFTINASAYRRERLDRFGRALPHWDGCRRLGAREWVLLGDSPDSFDSRYWGPVGQNLIEGVWRPMSG